MTPVSPSPAIPKPVLPGLEGSATWQLVFLVGCAIFALMQMRAGWKLGPIRMILNLAALLAAYAAGLFGGKLLVPLFRGFLTMPDFLLSVLGGVLIGVVAYACISGLGSVLFRKTKDQESGFVRIMYGITGALMGLVTGGIMIWALVLGLRLLGTVSESRIRAEAEAAREVGEGAQAAAPSQLTLFLAKLMHSLQQGPTGAVVEQVDVVPEEFYEVLTKVARTVSNPVSVARFMDFPGARELAQHPKVREVAMDPTVAELAAKGDYMGLISNPALINAANDPDLAKELKKFDLLKALDFALQRPAGRPIIPGLPPGVDTLPEPSR